MSQATRPILAIDVPGNAFDVAPKNKKLATVYIDEGREWALALTHPTLNELRLEIQKTPHEGLCIVEQMYVACVPRSVRKAGGQPINARNSINLARWQGAVEMECDRLGVEVKAIEPMHWKPAVFAGTPAAVKKDKRGQWHALEILKGKEFYCDAEIRDSIHKGKINPDLADAVCMAWYGQQQLKLGG